MRTNIDIDDDLMKRAMEVLGLKTKKETVEEALRTIVKQREAHEALMALYGTVKWEGDLDQMRRNRPQAEGDW
ncbi:type II toxin-antitoxin system VapB family antitoxin [Aureimonas psammosilenae]|uniref:type II toxin-antitoxin system VapB family antitoxin n=1 Tax=Aureimonas psammosilenae TaxID=2495496 RepID=UPI0012607132|nr:type II toxin-antitoxin system VapB family antitoxin [Aureimonas psammosilenae]